MILNQSKQLKTFKQLAPNKAWLVKNKRDLMMDIFGSNQPEFVWYQNRLIQATSFVLSVIFIIAGTTTGASLAQNGLPGDLLYPIKLANERIQLALATSDIARADLSSEFANRRLQEFRNLVNQNSAEQLIGKEKALVQVVGDFAKQVAIVNQHVNNLVVDDSTTALPIAQQINLETMKYENALLDAKAKVTQPASQKELQHALASVQQVQTDSLKVLINQADAEKDILVQQTAALQVSNHIQKTEDQISLIKIEANKAALDTNSEKVTVANDSLAKAAQANDVLDQAKTDLAGHNLLAALEKVEDSRRLAKEADEMVVGLGNGSGQTAVSDSSDQEFPASATATSPLPVATSTTSNFLETKNVLKVLQVQ